MRILPSQQIDSNEGELKSPPSKRRRLRHFTTGLTTSCGEVSKYTQYTIRQNAALRLNLRLIFSIHL